MREIILFILWCTEMAAVHVRQPIAHGYIILRASTLPYTNNVTLRASPLKNMADVVDNFNGRLIPMGHCFHLNVERESNMKASLSVVGTPDFVVENPHIVKQVLDTYFGPFCTYDMTDVHGRHYDNRSVAPSN